MKEKSTVLLCQSCKRFFIVILVGLWMVGTPAPVSASPCGDVIFKGCLLDSLHQINETTDDDIVRVNTKLLLHLLDGDPSSGIKMLNKFDNIRLREYFAVAAVRTLEIDGRISEANNLLAQITGSAERATATAYRALVRGNAASALEPALIAFRFGEYEPILGVLELASIAKSTTECSGELTVTRGCVAQRIKQAIASAEGPVNIAPVGKSLIAAIEGKNKRVVKLLKSFSDDSKSYIALLLQRAYVIMNQPNMAERLLPYVKSIKPAYALNKALAANNLLEAKKAMESAVREGSLHAFLDLYQDSPAYPDSPF